MPWLSSGSPATSASAIAMISAERIKSVRTAPATFWRSSVAASSRHLLVRRFVPAEQRLDHLLGALEAEIGAADHQQRRNRPGSERG